jgi:hypothetical protein
MNVEDESAGGEPSSPRRLPAMQEGALPAVWTGPLGRYGLLLRAIDVHRAMGDRLVTESRPDLALTSWELALAISAELCLACDP